MFQEIWEILHVRENWKKKYTIQHGCIIGSTDMDIGIITLSKNLRHQYD